MQDFRKLFVYSKAVAYCKTIYKFSAELPLSEKFGLISQIRRAATSVALNIAEGAGTTSNREFALFITYAYRSVNEILTCLTLIKKLKLSTNEAAIPVLEKDGLELSRMLYSFSKKLTHKI